MSQQPEQQIESFQKEMQQRFMKDLQNIEIDSDSQLQASTEFYEQLKKKINSQITNMRASTTQNTILTQLKATLTKEMDNANQFQSQIQQMKFLNTAAQSAIAPSKIQQIKNKIRENNNQSKIILADEVVEQKESRQSKVIFEEVQLEEVEEEKQLNNRNQQNKRFNKKTAGYSAVNAQIQRKINLAHLQRERINMHRQDQRSMKYEQHCISQFFKQRFLTFHMPPTSTQKTSINLNITKPKSTFTNLSPLPNNEKNVLPKNSPEIALKTLKKNKRVSLMPTSQAQVKIEFRKILAQLDVSKVNKLNEVKSLAKVADNTNKSEFKQLLQPYLKSIKNPLCQLQKISSTYKPKFIKNYLNQNQKISNIDISDKQDKQRSVQQIMQMNNEFQIEGRGSMERDPRKFREFKLTFESLTSLRGIEKYDGVEYVALQYNVVKSVKELCNCKRIIELNLSNNAIRDARPIEQLPELRYLNLSNNKISQFSFSGGSLEILKLKKNQVQVINDLNSNKYLRIIDLSQNNLHQVGKGFSQLYFLQQLILTKNYIESFNNCEHLLMLQKLDLSYNRLSKITTPLTFLFLNYLNLSYNQLTHLPQLFLPSLQKFYVTNNKLTGDNLENKPKIIYLPQLKQFNLDDNEIKGFSIVWSCVRYSKKLEIVKYDSNQYFLSVREKVRELYEAILYRNMKNLKILNHSPWDSGIKAYYESVYSSYLQKGSKLQTVDNDLQKVQQFIAFLVQQNKIISDLEEETSKHKNQRFTQENVFIEAKSVKRALMLQKVVEMLGEKLSNLTVKKQSSSTSSLLQIDQQIYFYHDNFQANLLKKVHKIKSLFYKIKYQKEKRKKYFLTKKYILSPLLKQVSSLITTNQIKKIIKAFSQALKKNNQLSAVICIQRHWRGYKSRKLFKKMMKKLKQNLDDDDFQMQEVDLDEFQTHQFPEFNFDMPDDINFENYIIEPKYFQMAAQKEKKRNSKYQKQSKKLQQIEQKGQEYNPMMNNFVREQKKKEDKTKQKEQDDRMMKQWGFQNPATLQALRWKKKKKQEMKRKQAEQNMTAAQRLQRFKHMHK